MKINYDSYYLHSIDDDSLASRTVKWLPMDSAARYNENLKSNRQALESNGWIDKEITYQFNSSAFRCEEFTNDPSIIFLGCSHTIGIGLPIEHTWPTIVADKLNLKCYNLGQGGGSADSAYRLGSYWIPKLLPKVVVFLIPAIHRLEMVKGHHVEFLSPMNSNRIYSGFYNNWTYFESNCWLNSQKNTLALENISNRHNCKFVSSFANNINRIDLARDLAHAGIQSNLEVSNTVLTLINQ